MAKPIPYCIPDRRDLTEVEHTLLRYLLEHEAPQRLAELDSIKVVARCGCGKCPTILFGTALESEPRTGSPFTEIASYRGRNVEGVVVVAALIERNGQLAELEAWSPEGLSISSWPSTPGLERFPWH